MNDIGKWAQEAPVAITVTDAAGVITCMNALSMQTFSKEGGGRLVGKSVFDCHPGEARGRIARLYGGKKPNHYTIRKNGVRKIIHQIPLARNGEFAGFVEISVPIPDEIPEFDRDLPADGATAE